MTHPPNDMTSKRFIALSVGVTMPESSPERASPILRTAVLENPRKFHAPQNAAPAFPDRDASE